MLINKPCCDFKMCRNHFDGNCINTTEYERCSYNRQKADNEALQFSVQQLSGFISSAKVEAIKEYKEKVIKVLLGKSIFPVLVKNALNEAEKEMVGENDV
jgi:hypothetical protein